MPVFMPRGVEPSAVLVADVAKRCVWSTFPLTRESILAVLVAHGRGGRVSVSELASLLAGSGVPPRRARALAAEGLRRLVLAGLAVPDGGVYRVDAEASRAVLEAVRRCLEAALELAGARA